MTEKEVYNRLSMLVKLFLKKQSEPDLGYEEMFDYLEVAIKYILFDSEAVNRENKVLQKRIRNN